MQALAGDAFAKQAQVEGKATQVFWLRAHPIAKGCEGLSVDDLFEAAVEQDAGAAGPSESGLDPANPHGR